MGTLNVKIPDEMEDDIEAFLEHNPHYLNRSELVRDALRHMLASGETGAPFGSVESDAGSDPLFTAPAVTVDDPVAPDELDDVVYDAPDE